MAFQRWYDFDVRLSGVVRSMESMSERNQEYFAEKLLELSEYLLEERGGEEYLTALHPKKKEGLEKAQSKKRWYDKSESLHRAFNNLYALTTEDRQEVATRMTTPILIVEAYEKQCETMHLEPDVKIVEEILRTCLTEGQERAKRLYALYMNDFSVFQGKNMAGATPENTMLSGLWSSLLKNIQSYLSPVA
ncbi:MAG TPA: hypothetical protein V6C52_01075 [Coleofasciculaceae cyanobacterium]